MQTSKTVIDTYFTQSHFCEIRYFDTEKDAYVINLGSLNSPDEIEIGFFTDVDKAFNFYDSVCKTLGEKIECEWRGI